MVLLLCISTAFVHIFHEIHVQGEWEYGGIWWWWWYKSDGWPSYVEPPKMDHPRYWSLIVALSRMVSSQRFINIIMTDFNEK